jgi:hypothetical protein
MDLKAKYLSETCSDPIEFLRQLRQTTEPIGGGTEYSEDGEFVEYDVAIEAVKKADDAFIEKVINFLNYKLDDVVATRVSGTIIPHHVVKQEFIDDFVKFMRE